VFGGAAGIFFIGYFLFEVPSNLALNKFGARVWIARIMFTWGIISAAQAFVVGVASLNIVRFLLGVAEAGFFPGIIFFLTLWIPSACRARIGFRRLGNWTTACGNVWPFMALSHRSRY